MQRMILDFANHCNIIYCPLFVVSDIEKYQKRFLAWLYDKSNDHSYWVYDGAAEKYGVAYDAAAFIEWLNEFAVKDDGEKVFDPVGAIFDRDEIDALLADGVVRIYF